MKKKNNMLYYFALCEPAKKKNNMLIILASRKCFALLRTNHNYEKKKDIWIFTVLWPWCFSVIVYKYVLKLFANRMLEKVLAHF